VRPGPVAARDERILGLGNPLKGALGIWCVFDPGRIMRRADDDKVVIHDVTAIHPKALLHKLFLKFGSMH